MTGEGMKTEQEFNPGALEGLLRLGGSGFVIQMIDLFFEHVPEQLALMRGAGEAVVLERAAHSLKSSARTVGAEGMYRLAERMEVLARRGEAEELWGLREELEASYARVAPRLRAERERLGVS